MITKKRGVNSGSSVFRYVVAAVLFSSSVGVFAKWWGEYNMHVAPTGHLADSVNREQHFASHFFGINGIQQMSVWRRREYQRGDRATAYWPQGGRIEYRAKSIMDLFAGDIMFSAPWNEVYFDDPMSGPSVVAGGNDYDDDCYGDDFDDLQARGQTFNQVDNCLLSPLVLDLGRNGFKLSKAGNGVYFDLLANGSPVHMQWTKRNTDDAFLVLDLNLNGLIDDGSELFGHGTTIIGTGDKAGDGFIALRQYDTAALGGNDDGKLNKKDQVWGSLGLWIDSNRDGVSQDGELHELSDFGVRKISLNVREGSTDPDRAGNVLPIWSWVTTEDTVDLPNKLKMADVFFRWID